MNKEEVIIYGPYKRVIYCAEIKKRDQNGIQIRFRGFAWFRQNFLGPYFLVLCPFETYVCLDVTRNEYYAVCFTPDNWLEFLK